LKVAEFFAKKNKQYSILDRDSPGLTADLFDMEGAKDTADQYNPELSIPEAEC
jgi:hypothetical protein